MLAMTNIKSNYAELATQWAKRYREILTEAAMVCRLPTDHSPADEPFRPTPEPSKKRSSP
jgi:hypothetical protein